MATALQITDPETGKIRYVRSAAGQLFYDLVTGKFVDLSSGKPKEVKGPATMDDDSGDIVVWIAKDKNGKERAYKDPSMGGYSTPYYNAVRKLGQDLGWGDSKNYGEKSKAVLQKKNKAFNDTRSIGVAGNLLYINDNGTASIYGKVPKEKLKQLTDSANHHTSSRFIPPEKAEDYLYSGDADVADRVTIFNDDAGNKVYYYNYSDNSDEANALKDYLEKYVTGTLYGVDAGNLLAFLNANPDLQLYSKDFERNKEILADYIWAAKHGGQIKYFG